MLDARLSTSFCSKALQGPCLVPPASATAKRSAVLAVAPDRIQSTCHVLAAANTEKRYEKDLIAHHACQGRRSHLGKHAQRGNSAPTSNSAATRPGSNKRFLFLPFTDVPGRNGDTLCISRSRPKQSGAPRPGGYACRAVALKQFRRSTVPIFHLRVRRDTPNRFFLVAPLPLSSKRRTNLGRRCSSPLAIQHIEPGSIVLSNPLPFSTLRKNAKN